MRQILFSSRWLPAWTQRDHPVVRWQLRNPALKGINGVIFGSTVGLFLIFGSLSLPMLYFLLSLMVIIQLAVGTTRKIHTQEDNRVWELILATPLPRHEVLLGTWAAGMWQIQQTLLMPIYRLMQALIVIGILVFGLWFAEIHIQPWLAMLVGGTLVIIVQPLADMYFGGMIGLLSANLIKDRVLAQAFAITAVLMYWAVDISIVLLLLSYDLSNLSAGRVIAALVAPVVLPTALGYCAFKLAIHKTQ